MKRRSRGLSFVVLPVMIAVVGAGALMATADQQRLPVAAAPGQTPETAAVAKPVTDEAKAAESAEAEATDLQAKVDDFFGKYLVTPLEKVLFFDFGTERWLCPCELPESKWEEDEDGNVIKTKGTKVPLVVVWLLLGAIFFTLRMGFINIRGFWHGIRLTKGDYDNPAETGEVSHFQALASALSATVGLGNIAGVAIAVGTGGPGAIFWMIMAGLLGMSSKFCECTLAQMYRKVAPDGTVSGGPMRYLYDGLKELRVFGIGLGGLGFVLAALFTLLCIGASFGGGCAFQVNQSLNAIREQMSPNWQQYRELTQQKKEAPGQRAETIEQVTGLLGRMELRDACPSDSIETEEARKWLAQLPLSEADRQEMDGLLQQWRDADEQSETPIDEIGELSWVERNMGWLVLYGDWVYGCIMALMVGIVIIGGIRRIAATAERIVPLMCSIYVITTVYILAVNYDKIGWAFEQVFSEAFKWNSFYGGLLGVLVVGLKRAAFSNEAGIGSAAIAHAAARTEEPIREGLVASLGPFIDTVVICTMTGLVIVITGAYNNPEYAQLVAAENGAALTSRAFGGVVSWFPWILSVAVILFAYSTMISWSYYGERCWSHITGHRGALVYRLAFLVFVVLGAVVAATKVLIFSDLMLLSMAFPNVLGVALLSGKIRRALDDYWRRYKAGEMERR